MGNPDLIIIINDDYTVEVKGKHYHKQTDAVTYAMAAYESHIRKLKEQADYPQELTYDIKTVRVYELQI